MSLASIGYGRLKFVDLSEILSRFCSQTIQGADVFLLKWGQEK